MILLFEPNTARQSCRDAMAVAISELLVRTDNQPWTREERLIAIGDLADCALLDLTA